MNLSIVELKTPLSSDRENFLDLLTDLHDLCLSQRVNKNQLIDQANLIHILMSNKGPFITGDAVQLPIVCVETIITSNSFSTHQTECTI